MGRSNCPTWGKTCDKCKKRNHFAAKCFGEKKSTLERHVRAADRVNGVQLPAKRKGIFAKMLVNGEEVTFQLDSGASVNIMPRNCVPDTKLDPTQTRLFICSSRLKDTEYYLKKYAAVFDGKLGKLPGTVTIHINDAAEPVVLPIRLIPLAVGEEFSRKVNNLITKGVLDKVHEPTDWVTQVVVGTKSLEN
ncbi:unnamed protein product [Echinostoma caproni]|uniref:Peptidase A2 domain-containing protein n=1 Tax=Echinostoma caproni TaxID=27848 RepID=A0A183B7Q6_9TREM|nr:unnamed protein product [Echinostoma caproni]